jgi:ABC-2 type transport system ATP-binding protein
MLTIERLTKKYGDKYAVDNLSLHIARGEICGFIGHNGAGKTTTVKAVCGILGFDKGEIYIGGKSIKQESLACKKRIAYIPDNPDLYDFLSGIKYLNFIADVYGVDATGRKERIRKYAEMFELTDDLAQPVAAYSHGMKQKLALISALIHEPELMVLDEPFVGLDPKASRVIKDIMRDRCARGAAVFFSTHVLEVAEKLCDKIAIIKDGRLAAHGDMNKVLGDSSLETVFFELQEGEGAAND